MPQEFESDFLASQNVLQALQNRQLAPPVNIYFLIDFYGLTKPKIINNASQSKPHHQKLS